MEEKERAVAWSRGTLSIIGEGSTCPGPAWFSPEKMRRERSVETAAARLLSCAARVKGETVDTMEERWRIRWAREWW